MIGDHLPKVCFLVWGCLECKVHWDLKNLWPVAHCLFCTVELSLGHLWSLVLNARSSSTTRHFCSKILLESWPFWGGPETLICRKHMKASKRWKKLTFSQTRKVVTSTRYIPFVKSSKYYKFSHTTMSRVYQHLIFVQPNATLQVSSITKKSRGLVRLILNAEARIGSSFWMRWDKGQADIRTYGRVFKQCLEILLNIVL